MWSENNARTQNKHTKRIIAQSLNQPLLFLDDLLEISAYHVFNTVSL